MSHTTVTHAANAVDLSAGEDPVILPFCGAGRLPSGSAATMSS